MKTLLLATTAAILYAGTASAVPIAAGSELSITGPDTFTSTTITFTGPGDIVGNSGSFTEMGTCTMCVTMVGTLDATTAATLYTALNLGNTATQSTTPPNSINFNPGTPGVTLPSLTISGAGSITLTGFDTTPGIWEVTTQGPTLADVSFSATSVTSSGVAEPGTLAILGAALLGFVGWRWRQRSGGPALA